MREVTITTLAGEQSVDVSLGDETGGPAATRLGTVTLVVSLGLFAQCLGDTLARFGTEEPALPLFFLGLIAIFAPCAWRLTASEATRRERVQVSLVLGVGLLASFLVRSPLILDELGELFHLATLTRMIATRQLFAANTMLPVSPYYPGLELLTTATKWITGLPLLLAELTVMLAARCVLVLAVFLVVERVCASSRAGGIGVLVYAASPRFYVFDGQYASETLALALAAGLVYFLLVSIDQSRQRTGRPFVVSVACIGALVVTHALTSWLATGLLVAGAAGFFVLRRRAEARLVGLAAAVGVAVTVAWSALVGSRLSLASALGNLRGHARIAPQRRRRCLAHLGSRHDPGCVGILVPGTCPFGVFGHLEGNCAGRRP